MHTQHVRMCRHKYVVFSFRFCYTWRAIRPTHIYLLHTSPAHTVQFPMMRNEFHILYFTLHCTRVLNDVVITTIIEMVEMVEILDRRVGKRLVERVRYVINN